jgi:putative ubiquitin-RnfH superfamily antitoxin RatB of RatAB toxin-antitoxin module
MIRIELAYAPTGEVELVSLTVSESTTVGEAIKQSGLCNRYPDLDLDTVKTGIFGKLCSLDTLLHEGDRIEIYRPLRADPKEARRTRALRQKRTPR